MGSVTEANQFRFRPSLSSVVPAGGIEPTAHLEITQVTDSIKRQKRSNRQKRVSRLRGGYAEHCKGF
jgi:hypothetical protein